MLLLTGIGASALNRTTEAVAQLTESAAKK
jgi:hypothetical protein